MKKNSIHLQNISFSYDSKRPIFDNLSLTINKGDSVGVIGANGTGKSTLLKLLVGLITDYTGTIDIEGIHSDKKTISKIRQKTGYVFQDADNQLFMSTVYQDIAFGPANSGLTKEQTEQRVQEALQSVNISHLSSSAIHNLSGGEKKLVSIATILAMKPSVILMDEPTTALDPKNRKNLINILNSLSHTKIITSHDLDFVWDTCNVVVLINNGKIIAQGNPEEILRDKVMLETNGLELPLSLRKR